MGELDRVADLLAKAAEARAMADVLHDAQCIRTMSAIAVEYEALAERLAHIAEHVGKTKAAKAPFRRAKPFR